MSKLLHPSTRHALTRLSGAGPALAPQPFDYDDVIASLAIPPLYKDVRRRGTAFWDGLFSINPPINVLTNLGPPGPRRSG